MAFRDHLAAATIEEGETSLIHEMLEHSQSIQPCHDDFQ